ncbi:MAG: ABC transporter permease [Clostridia bacterium]|nr:ABC transporter permease [Clostridia bacterium]
MLAIRNGVKSALRTPGKTILFALILTMIAALLAVSFSVFSAVRGYINDCNGYFHTIAELEYVGRDYPDPFVYDEAVAEAVEENRGLIDELMANEAVTAFEPASAYIAVSDSIHRFDENVMDPNAAVLDVNVMSYDSELSMYTVLVNNSLYSRNDYTGKLVLLKTFDGMDAMQIGKNYTIAGRFFKGNTSNPWFAAADLTYSEGGVEVTVDKPVLSSEVGPDSEFHKLARDLHFKNDSVRVTYTSSIEDLYPFHQQILKLDSGRFFTEEEYASRAKVCIISERIAGLLDLKTGDSIRLDIFTSDGGNVYDSGSLRETDSGEYEIVGIQTDSASFPYRVFMPVPDSSGGIVNVNGYTLGQFRLKNDKAAAFSEASAALFEKGFRVNVYDQGYSAATEPMRELLLISAVFLAVCLLMAVCALALQSHLFVGRQREAARTMHDLGSGKAHIIVYFLSSALLLSLIGAALGCAAAKLMEGRVFGLLKDFASQFANTDLRFSSSSLALSRTLELSPAPGFIVYLAAGLVLAAGAVILTLIFSAAAMKTRTGSAGKRTVKARVPRRARTSRLSGMFKYGLLSMRRGGARTIAVLAMGVVAAVFFGRLVSSLEGYREQLASYIENAQISGYATDSEGHRLSGLVLKSKPIFALSSSDLVKDCNFSSGFGHIMFIWKVGDKYVEYTHPATSFAYETTFDKIWKSPAWTGVSSVSGSPLFHYSASGSVEWLEGYGEEDFKRVDVVRGTYEDYDPYTGETRTEEYAYETGLQICALSRDTMEEYGIKLGDELEAAYGYYADNGSGMISYISGLKVVACYTSATKSSEVFSPLTLVQPDRAFAAMSNYYDESELENGGQDMVWINGERITRSTLAKYRELGLVPGLSYSSFTFGLADNTRLDELRDKLTECGFTYVRSNDRHMTPAVIEDEIYLNTVHSMERQIQYVSVLYYALYIMAGAIGFVLAWLFVMSRRREIAVQRALGTQPARILLNFFLEQAILIFAGLALGLAATKLTGVDPSPMQLMLCAAFLALWALASLICLITGLRRRSFAALTEPE